MRTFALSSALAIALVNAPAFVSSARAEDRKAEDVLKAIHAVEMPALDRSNVNDETYVKEFIVKRQKAMNERCELVGELYKVDPENKELTKLLPARWQTMLGEEKAKEVDAEIADVMAKTKVPAFKTEAAFVKATVPFYAEDENIDQTLARIDEFVALAPKDVRAANLLMSAASMVPETSKQTELLGRVIKDYPTSPTKARAETKLKFVEDSIGKPLNLEFTDAIKGTEVSIKGMKGKVVVVDFWATWCGPCVKDMPKMKGLYAKYRDKGVEFIGVSLDQPKQKGGLDKLKAFVAKNEIAWPQYYQGNYWQSEFSSSMKVDSIPCVFVVDAEGKLYSINGRGNLETLIPKLLKARASTGTGAGGGN